MSGWVRLSTGFYRHPKALAAGPNGRNLYVAALAWCGEYNTDGHIHSYVLQTLAVDAGIPVDEAGAITDRLVEVRLWSRTPDGWRIHDWSEWQTTAEERDAKLTAERERKARWRERKRNASRDADATRPERLSEAEAETETETVKELSLAPHPNTPVDNPIRRERETKKALTLIAKHLATEADRPAAYAGTIVKQALQLPELEALAQDHPADKAQQLADRYLASLQPTAQRPRGRCGICGSDPHPNGASGCPVIQ